MITKIDAAIQEAATAAGLDPLLVQAVIAQESSGQPHAYRYEPAYYERYLKGNPEWDGLDPNRVSASYGLMQVMYPTARDLGFTGDPEALFVVPTNLALGCKLLKTMLTRFHGQVALALAAYNGGPGGVRRPGPIRYAQQVFNRYVKLKEASQ